MGHAEANSIPLSADLAIENIITFLVEALFSQRIRRLFTWHASAPLPETSRVLSRSPARLPSEMTSSMYNLLPGAYVFHVEPRSATAMLNRVVRMFPCAYRRQLLLAHHL
ncbi:hypothetical protein HYPSUDRAFT_337511 [Hypholoma sublateritium FD-334 SS-4]|uniref:Uncharacterized protein n=1 Tax=Hypholoma sublateritium (strain FD-334 SS-4) TaxID=945553 RepID=A0A0D2N9G5_HYPSF|nr:hypothetical protein HYPSUDRAFT_337511 [Hypholoma sublateritium FD-334 SS-4]